MSPAHLVKRIAEARGRAQTGRYPPSLTHPAGRLPITAPRMAVLWDTLDAAYQRLGFDDAAGGDSVSRDLVLARIIEPTSKLDSLRVLEEVGSTAPSYATVKRRLPHYAKPAWRQALSSACADHTGLGPATTPCTSRPIKPTSSGYPASRRNVASSRRSPSGCLPTRPGSQCRSKRSRATGPRPPPCYRPSRRSRPSTSSSTCGEMLSPSHAEPGQALIRRRRDSGISYMRGSWGTGCAITGQPSGRSP